MSSLIFKDLEEYYDAMQEWFSEIASNSGHFRPYLKKVVFGSGKRIRPIFALLSCEAICGDYTRALPVAVAYELAHHSSLIQDDIMDRSPKRRYAKSIYSEFGLNTAILTSDMLIFEIFSLLARYRDYKLSSDRIYQILEMVGRSAKATALGEFVDNEIIPDGLVDESAYLDMIQNKTGALLGASAACGGIVGGGSKKETEILYQFGVKAGTAYQIQDDILDLLSEEELVGKSVFSDMKNRKKNIVLIHAFQNASPEEQTFLRGLFGKQWFLEEEILRAREILKRVGSIEYARRLAFSIVEDGKRELLKLVLRTRGREKLIDFWYSLSKFAADSEGPIIQRETGVTRTREPSLRLAVSSP